MAIKKMEINKINNILDIKFELPTQVWALISRRYYGKTIMCTNLLISLLENHKISKIYVVSDTANLNSSYDAFVKKKNIFPSEKLDSVISKLLAYQKSKKKDARKNIILVLDDLPLAKISKGLSFIATAGRHYNIGSILCVQHAKGLLSPSIRGNLDVTMIGELPRSSVEALYESWVTPYDDFHSFYKFYRDNVEKPVFLCYNAREQKRNDRLFLVSCDILPEDLKIKRKRNDRTKKQ